MGGYKEEWHPRAFEGCEQSAQVGEQETQGDTRGSVGGGSKDDEGVYEIQLQQHLGNREISVLCGIAKIM